MPSSPGAKRRMIHHAVTIAIPVISGRVIHGPKAGIQRRGPPEEEIVEQVDQLVEADDPEGAGPAHQDGKTEQDGVLGEIQVVEPLDAALPGPSRQSPRRIDQTSDAAREERAEPAAPRRARSVRH